MAEQLNQYFSTNVSKREKVLSKPACSELGRQPVRRYSDKQNARGSH